MSNEEKSFTTEISTPEDTIPGTLKSFNNESRKKPVIEYKWKRRVLLFGITLSSVCATFNGAAIGSAVGKVASDMKDFENFSWYLIGFLLSSAIFQLLATRLSDCLGRRRICLFGISLMLFSSLLSGLSINSTMLIIFRLLQGVSAGLCQTMSIVVLIDLFPLEQRIKYQSNNAIAYGFTQTAGPIFGGIFADKLSWRYIFWLNAIFAAIVLVIFYFLIEIPIKQEQRLSVDNLKTLFTRIDTGGCLLVSTGIIVFLMSMNFGSSSLKYDWSSPLVVGLLAGSFGVGILFIIYERFVSSIPLIPSRVITDRDMALIYVQQFMNGVYFIGINLTAVVTFQSVYNDSTTIASLKIVPATVSFILATQLQVRCAKIRKNTKSAIIIGNIFVLLSSLFIAFIENKNSKIGIPIMFITLSGTGIGLTNQGTLTAFQLILEKKAPELAATGLSLIRFFVQIGGTIGTSVFLSILRTQVMRNLESLHQTQQFIYQNANDSGIYKDYAKFRLIKDESIKSALNGIYLKSVSSGQYMYFVGAFLALLCSIFVKIPNVTEKKDKETSSIELKVHKTTK